MATELRIKAEIGKICTLYRHHMAPDEFDVVAEAWGDFFQDVPDAEFVAAVKACLRESSWFPKPADILRHVEELRAEEYRRQESKRGRTALPEYDTATETICAYNAAKARELLDNLFGKMAVRQ